MKLRVLIWVALLLYSMACQIKPRDIIKCLNEKTHKHKFTVEDVTILYPNTKPTKMQRHFFQKMDLNQDHYLDLAEINKIHEKISCSTINHMFKKVC